MTLVSISGNPVPDGVVTGEVRTPDGVTLRFARWDSPASGKGTVCVFTGRSEFIEKYFETVRDLRKRGFTVATMDWRGQGHSSRQLPDPRKGHVESFSDFETDVETFMQRVVLPNCPPPYFALAHSMGGAVLLRSAHSGKRWFERTIVVAPMIDFPRARASLPLRILMRALRLAGLGRATFQAATSIGRGRRASREIRSPPTPRVMRAMPGLSRQIQHLELVLQR